MWIFYRFLFDYPLISEKKKKKKKEIYDYYEMRNIYVQKQK